ncbi:MAG TPA: site-2 protease family protein [Clostridia bacterium]|nr:site-2 protease family protein [Clostridia bacterium]
MTKNLYVGKIKGITIELNSSWFVVVILVSFVFSNFYLPFFYPNWSSGAYWSVGVCIALLLYASILIHELSHSLVARKYGINVDKITLFIFGGLAHLSRDAKTPEAELKISAAGPLASLGLFIGFRAVYVVFSGILPIEPIAAIGLFVSNLNLAIAIFNSVPAMPLDGGRMLRALIWKYSSSRNKGTKVANISGGVFANLLIFFGILIVMQGNIINGIWLCMIGLFLGQSSRFQAQNVKVEKLFHGMTVRNLMTRDIISVSPGMTVDQVIRGFFYNYKHPCFPVMENGKVLGLLTVHSLKNVHRSEINYVRIEKIYMPLDSSFTISPDEEIVNVIQMIMKNPLGRFLVIENERLEGIISKTDIIKYISIHQDIQLDAEK